MILNAFGRDKIFPFTDISRNLEEKLLPTDIIAEFQ